MAVYKFLGLQRSISTANNIDGYPLARVFCSSSSVLTLAFANGTTYANATIGTGEVLIVEKAYTDTLQGANMIAVPIAYRN